MGKHLSRATASWSFPEIPGGKALLFPHLSVLSSKRKKVEERKVQAVVERSGNILGESILVTLLKFAQHYKCLVCFPGLSVCVGMTPCIALKELKVPLHVGCVQPELLGHPAAFKNPILYS